METRDAAVLLDIFHASRLIAQFIAEIDEEDFMRDVLVQSAVLHQLLVIGEATKHFPHPFGRLMPTCRGN